MKLTDAFGDRDSGQDVPVLAKALRVIGVVAMGSIGLNLVLGGVIASMMPLREVVPYFLEISPAVDATVRLVKASQTSELDWARAERAWVRQYVEVAESVVADGVVMAERVRPPGNGNRGGWLARRSTGPVYQAWRVRMEQFVKGALQRRLTRVVAIEEPIEQPAPGVYTISFRTHDSEAGREGPPQRWRVTLRVAYAQQVELKDEPEKSSMVDEIFGFTVVGYEYAKL